MHRISPTTLLILLLCSTATVLTSCGRGDPDQQANSKQADAAKQREGTGRSGERDWRGRSRARPVPVAVTPVQRGRVDAYYASTTTLTAVEEAVVVARTQGIVEEIYVEEGDSVTEGQPLTQLDTKRLQLEVARTRTNLESLQRAAERSKQLFESKMISTDAYDQVNFEYAREKATLALQLHELEEATIRAPITGVITIRHIKLGHTLSPNEEAFEIKRANKLEAILNVPEKELFKLAVGQHARIKIDALPDILFEGRVERVAPEVDRTSGTFRVTVRLDNMDLMLKPGMFARVNIRYDSREDVLLVARDAVVTQKDESTVFVVKDGLAMRQSVETGYVMDTEIEILNGLGEGDQVIVTGQGGLRDGAAVRVVPL